MRNPVGWVFWPMELRPYGSEAAGAAWEVLVVLVGHRTPGEQRLRVGQADGDVARTAADHVGHAAGAGHEPLEHRAAIAPGVGDDQVADVADPAVFGVGHGTLEDLLDHPRPAVRQVLEGV